LRLNQQYGGDYTAKVLIGSGEAQIVERGHDGLSTFGILQSENKRTVRDWIEQLVGQDFLVKAGEFNVLKVTAAGRSMLKGDQQPQLLRPARKTRSRRAAPVADSWEGVDRGLFEELRTMRRAEATTRNLPPYMIFDDATLRDMARRRPTSGASFHEVRGVGEKKLKDFGEEFVALITDYCDRHALTTDIPAH